ncbi:MAG TPA: hypothetical protein VKB77_09055 [Terriglobales bacterium]|nr:hypothetical protein [Terriglobales bacterium]
MRFLVSSLVLMVASVLSPGQTTRTAPTTLTEDEIRALIRQAAEKDIENDRRQRDYTYVEREEQHKLDGSGHTKSVESKTKEIMVLYGEPVERLIAKDDKPLSPTDTAKEDERIQKIVDKRRDESESERGKRLAKEQKEREDDRRFVREVTDAYNFRLAGVENLNGRAAWVIDAEPRPGFQPHSKEAKILPKFRFRAWIDQADSEWVKLTADCIDTVSIGLVLARIHKGSHIEIDQTRVNEEVWLPKHVAVKLDARLALLANINVEEEVTYRDYKKFRADTKIVPVGEQQ